jgi:hypothetical protein
MATLIGGSQATNSRYALPTGVQGNGHSKFGSAASSQGKSRGTLTMQMADLSGANLDLLRSNTYSVASKRRVADPTANGSGLVPTGPSKNRNKLLEMMEMAERRGTTDLGLMKKESKGIQSKRDLDRLMGMTDLVPTGAPIAKYRGNDLDLVPTGAPLAKYRGNDLDHEEKLEEGCFTIPTGAPTRSRSKLMDAAKLSSKEDLTTLKTKDPFMYFSLPGATKANLVDRDLDVGGIKRTLTLEKLKNEEKASENQGRFTTQTNESWGRPSSLRRINTDSNLHVKRQTRITTETHFGILFEDMVREMQDSSMTFEEKRRRVLSEVDEETDDEDYINPAE